MDDLLDLSKALFVALFIITVLLCAPMFGIALYTEYRYCEQQMTLNPEYEYQWVFDGGCMVKTPSGYWASAHDYIIVENTK